MHTDHTVIPNLLVNGATLCNAARSRVTTNKHGTHRPQAVDSPAPVILDVPSLTQRQTQVCELITQGMANNEIAAHLGLSAATVKAHRGEAMRRLQAKSVADLVRAYLAVSRPGDMTSLLDKAKPIRAHVLDRDEGFGLTLAATLAKLGVVTRHHRSEADLWPAAEAIGIDVLIVSLYPDTPDLGFEWLAELRQRTPAGLFVILPSTRVKHREFSREGGADAVFEKPVIVKELHMTMRNLVDRLVRS
jgi:DNA-binding CsgD family transcriptional regulator/CheY-like chemotaxis protein